MSRNDTTVNVVATVTLSLVVVDSGDIVVADGCDVAVIVNVVS